MLVVDDDESQRKLMTDLLSSYGFEVIVAPSAEDAFGLLNTHQVDCFLLDVAMPEINGWQLAIQLRKDQYMQPIMMVSANALDYEKENLLAGFHDAYISKPIDINQLLEALANLLHIVWLTVPENENHTLDRLARPLLEQQDQESSVEAYWSPPKKDYLSDQLSKSSSTLGNDNDNAVDGKVGSEKLEDIELFDKDLLKQYPNEYLASEDQLFELDEKLEIRSLIDAELDPEFLLDLKDYAEIGHIKGFMDKLAEFERADQATQKRYQAFYQSMKKMAEQFDFKQILTVLAELINE